MNTRSSAFRPERTPLQHHPSLQLLSERVHGPFSFLNPTQAHYSHQLLPPGSDSSVSGQERESTSPPGTAKSPSSVAYRWTSRNNRKGRHALVVSPAPSSAYTTPSSSSSAHAILQGIWRMFTYYPYWDVSYLVAVIFTMGSVIWVVNAFYAFLPYTNPGSLSDNQVLYGTGITGFMGATVFEIGSVFLMLEAINENRTGCFGWALEHVGGEKGALRLSPRKSHCTHHHGNKRNLVGKAPTHDSPAGDGEKAQAGKDGTPPGAGSWVWWPSWHEMRTHYLHDLGFLACCSQMFGATVFWISGFTALPQIFNALESDGQSYLNGAYWVPQVIGGAGFVVSGTLFMIETQKKWYLPAPGQLGWHIGLWNLIGGIGFTLCPIFGFSTVHWRQYQACCSTFWGSWAFLVGSAIQWYESLDKHPVETAKT